jgi:hypothetical protein
MRLGDTAQIRITVQSISGQMADPDEMTLVVRDGGGMDTSHALADMVRVSTGVYTLQLQLDPDRAPGTWQAYARCEDAGLRGSELHRFVVDDIWS